ncbi:MAG: hypothetical protein LBG76_10745 [Treponema sp.]|jgi:hypothetical protein|nr:hypothetical protein [Treponema sp.]
MNVSARFFLVLLFFFNAGAVKWTLSAQEDAEETEPVFYIRDITFNITGQTRPFVLMNHGEFQKGERITGRTNLEAYLRRKTQLLYNQRVLSQVRIEHTEGTADSGGEIPVDLLVSTVDTWNIIALPRPQWDDNDGFDLTIKARDYNFLGTMSPLRIDLGYNLKPEYRDNGFDGSKGSWNFEIDSDIPFRALGYNWIVNFDHFFSYIYDEPVSYKNITGISVEIPTALPFSPAAVITAGFDESFNVHEKNADRYKEEYGAYHKEEWYMSSEVYGQWKMPTGFMAGNFGEFIYTPKLSGKINYQPGGDVGDLRRNPTLGFSHTLGFGQIDWVSNYRSGLDVSIGNSNTLIFDSTPYWRNTLTFSATGHRPIFSFLGFSGMLQYRQWFNTYSDTAGDAIRGIVNKNLAAEYMLSLNLDFPFRILDFRPSIWFNQPKLRLFDLEFQLSPILDLALIRDPIRNIRFSPAEIQVGGGLELIIFSHFMRSLYLRVSVGYDLKKLFSTGDFGNNREVFIGLYHHY